MTYKEQKTLDKAITAREIWILGVIIYAALIGPVAFFSLLSGMAFDGGPPYPTGLYIAVYSCIGTAPMMAISVLVSWLAYMMKARKLAVGLLLLPLINLFGFFLSFFFS